MTIKHLGGVFGRNPTFNDVTIEGTLTFDGAVDITTDLTIDGVLTANGLVIDTDTLVVDATNNRVGIGTTSPDGKLDVAGIQNTTKFTLPHLALTATSLTDNTGFTGISYASSSLTNYGWTVGALRGSSGSNASFVFTQHNDSAAGDEKMRLDGSGNVGIGTSSPATSLHVLNTSDTQIRLSQSGEGSYDLGVIDGDKFAINRDGLTNEFVMSNGNVGIGTSSPGVLLDVSGATPTIRAIGTSASNPSLTLSSAGITAWSQTVSGSDSSLSFNRDGSEAMRIDSSGKVGIGTSSPATLLDVKSDSGMRLTDAGGVRFLDLTPATSGGASAEINSTSANGLRLNASGSGAEMFFDTNGSERVRIDSSGRVGIGTSSPNYTLDLQNANGGTLARFKDSDSSYKGIVIAGDTNSGWVGNDLSTTGEGIYYQNNLNAMRIYTNSSERMRIDSSGNLLVGTTTLGGLGVSISGSGYVNASRTSGQSGFFNRASTDGSIVSFYKDGSEVGSIGTAVGNAFYAGTATGITFGSANLYPTNASGTKSDGALDLGASANRFKDIYATNGTIQTSDRNEKQDIEELSDAEQRVAVACKGLLRKFRWKSSVADKGDEARIHFGIIAQDLQAAFEAEGLDAGRYGMFINSTWTDEETGKERSRMGVRYDQLLAFIIAAI